MSTAFPHTWHEPPTAEELQAMAEIGRVCSYKRRDGKEVFYLDFYPHLKGVERNLHSDRGVGWVENENAAKVTLQAIRMQATRMPLAEVVALRRKPDRRPNLVKTHAAAWLEEKAQEVAPYTLEGYQAAVRHHLDFWDGVIVREVTTANLKEWIRHLEAKGLATKTINGIALVVMRGILRRAREADPSLPVLEMPKAKRRGPRVRRQRMPLRDVLKTLLAIPVEDRGIYLHLFYTMSRPGEARGALVADYDFETGVFRRVRALKTKSGVNPSPGPTKTGEEGSCTLPLDLRAWLAEYARWRRNRPEMPLYANPRTGKAYRAGTLGDLWREAVERAQVPYVSVYPALRHSPGTALLEAGVSIGDVQAALDHTTSAMTESVYDLERQARRERAMRRLEELAGVALEELEAAEAESASEVRAKYEQAISTSPVPQTHEKVEMWWACTDSNRGPPTKKKKRD